MGRIERHHPKRVDLSSETGLLSTRFRESFHGLLLQQDSIFEGFFEIGSGTVSHGWNQLVGESNGRNATQWHEESTEPKQDWHGTIAMATSGLIKCEGTARYSIEWTQCTVVGWRNRHNRVGLRIHGWRCLVNKMDVATKSKNGRPASWRLNSCSAISIRLWLAASI